MLINTPSNPTGQAFSEAVLESINKFCEEHSIVLISDEIYSDICFDDEHKASALSGSRLTTGLKVLTGGLSKVRNQEKKTGKKKKDPQGKNGLIIFPC